MDKKHREIHNVRRRIERGWNRRGSKVRGCLVPVPRCWTIFGTGTIRPRMLRPRTLHPHTLYPGVPLKKITIQLSLTTEPVCI
jgi:hypothetical protein